MSAPDVGILPFDCGSSAAGAEAGVREAFEAEWQRRFDTRSWPRTHHLDDEVKKACEYFWNAAHTAENQRLREALDAAIDDFHNIRVHAPDLPQARLAMLRAATNLRQALAARTKEGGRR